MDKLKATMINFEDDKMRYSKIIKAELIKITNY